MITTTAAREIAELLATADDATIDAITDGDLALAHFQLSFELMMARQLVDAYDSATPEVAANGDLARHAKAYEVIGGTPVLINNLDGELFNRGAGTLGW